MTSIVDLEVSALSELIKQKELGIVEVNQAFLDRINALDSEINAWAHIDTQKVLDQARHLENEEWGGPLHGIPVGIKDVIDVAGLPTGFGNKKFQNNMATRDAMCVYELKKAGAVILGKTRTSEFATWTPSETKNPINPAHTPGGSSSGSAASVSARMVPLSLGTQTVGSTIRPAAFCGIVGFKPSFGYLSTKGINLTSQRLDTVGLFANSVADIALLYDALLIGRSESSSKTPEQTKVMVSKTPWWDKADELSRLALETAQKAIVDMGNMSVSEYEFENGFEKIPDLQNLVAHFDIANNLKDVYEENKDDFSDNLSARIEEGVNITFSEYSKAILEIDSLKNNLLHQWPDGAFMVTPATTGVAPEGLGWTGDQTFVQSWSILGNPVITVPVLRRPTDGLPVGVQIIGKYASEPELLAFAKALSEKLNYR